MLSSSFKETLKICSNYSRYEGLLVLNVQFIRHSIRLANMVFRVIILMSQVNPDKINMIIGSGGKKVKSIIEETGVESIETQDDGIVS